MCTAQNNQVRDLHYILHFVKVKQQIHDLDIKSINSNEHD